MTNNQIQMTNDEVRMTNNQIQMTNDEVRMTNDQIQMTKGPDAPSVLGHWGFWIWDL